MLAFFCSLETSYKDRTLSNAPTKEIAMFKHILLPTDGSELSEAAIQKGIQFAKSINAKVTGFHVILPFHSLHSSDGDARGYEGAV